MGKAVEFHIVSHWRVEAKISEVADVLSEPQRFPNWWGDVYLGVKTIAKGDKNHIGQTVAVYSRGWLPYRLNWQGTLTQNNMPHSWAIKATGDLDGEGVWTLVQNGPIAEITYDWRVRSDRLLFRALAPLFRKLMISNHHWAMAKGETGLKAEITRRRAFKQSATDA